METNRYFAKSLIALTLVFSMGFSPALGAETGALKLPGARPEIDAAHYSSLQAALEAVPAEGGMVRLPAGTFEITEPLVLTRSDVRMEGAGTATHIKNRNTHGQPALIIQHPDGRKVRDTNQLWRIMLSNFRITGNPKSGSGNTYGSIVSANMIEECAGAAIILDRDCYGNTLAANVIAHNGQGIDLRDAHGCAVSANTFTINATNALKIATSSGRITVTGNNFSNSYIGEGKVKRGTDDLAASGIVLSHTTDVTISGNLFSSVQPQALSTEGSPSRRVLFSNNVLTDIRQDKPNLQEAQVDHNLQSE